MNANSYSCNPRSKPCLFPTDPGFRGARLFDAPTRLFDACTNPLAVANPSLSFPALALLALLTYDVFPPICLTEPWRERPLPLVPVTCSCRAFSIESLVFPSATFWQRGMVCNTASASHNN